MTPIQWPTPELSAWASAFTSQELPQNRAIVITQHDLTIAAEVVQTLINEGGEPQAMTVKLLYALGHSGQMTAQGAEDFMTNSEKALEDFKAGKRQRVEP